MPKQSLGKCVISADNAERRITITIAFDPKKKPGMNAGVMSAVVNGVFDALRLRFCAHQIKVKVFKEPVVAKKKGIDAQRPGKA